MILCQWGAKNFFYLLSRNKWQGIISETLKNSKWMAEVREQTYFLHQNCENILISHIYVYMRGSVIPCQWGAKNFFYLLRRNKWQGTISITLKNSKWMAEVQEQTYFSHLRLHARFMIMYFLCFYDVYIFQYFFTILFTVWISVMTSRASELNLLILMID